MAIETEKTFLDYAAIWAPILIAAGSMYISWIAYNKAGQSSKEFFINSLRDKIISAKHTIINIEDKQFTQYEKMSILETVQDFVLYQGYQNEKKNFLTPYVQEELSKLQESIEDNIGSILIQEDILLNKSRAKSTLNAFLQHL